MFIKHGKQLRAQQDAAAGQQEDMLIFFQSLEMEELFLCSNKSNTLHLGARLCTNIAWSSGLMQESQLIRVVASVEHALGFG